MLPIIIKNGKLSQINVKQHKIISNWDYLIFVQRLRQGIIWLQIFNYFRALLNKPVRQWNWKIIPRIKKIIFLVKRYNVSTTKKKQSILEPSALSGRRRIHKLFVKHESWYLLRCHNSIQQIVLSACKPMHSFNGQLILQ